MLHAMQIPHTPPSSLPHASGWAPLALGFRPFFLLAALASVALMSLWLLAWRGHLSVPAYYDPAGWHAHEMLFGYTVGVIAGFLLTAVRNWSGVPTWTGARLGVLAALWLLGRLLPWLAGVPVVVVIGIDVAFLPLLAISLARPLWLDKNKANRVFLVLLSAMALANLLSHLQLLGMLDGWGDARRVMLELVLLLIVLVAGRVLPFFTRNVVSGFVPRTRLWVETASFGLLSLIVVLELSLPSLGGLKTATWLLFAVVQFVRLSGWVDRRVLAIPVLWVLHAGYAWLAIGALLQGLSLAGVFPANAALHALTVGAIGVFTLGMMARVARGHTGRPIKVTMLTTTAFLIMNVAVVVRVFGPAVSPENYAEWVDLSGGLWVLAFALFAFGYASVLMRPRIDGKPG